MKFFSVVTVSYDQNEYLSKLFDSVELLATQDIVCSEILVVDNYGSVVNLDSSSYSFNIRVIKPGNVGYLPGLSLGAEAALKDGIDFLVLCNPDLQFISSLDSDFLACIDSFGVVAPDIFDSDNLPQNPNRRLPFNRIERFVWDMMSASYFLYRLIMVFHEFKRQLRIGRSGNSQALSDNGVIFLPHGSCLFVSRGVLTDTGLFKEDIFLWGEEAIIAGMARQAGYSVFFNSAVRVRHISHTSTSSIGSKAKFSIWRESYKKYRKYLCRW